MKKGGLLETVLSHKNLELYKTKPFYLEVTVGCYASRIRDGEIFFNGKLYQLEKNAGDHHLHAGSFGYSYRNWSSRIQGDQLVLFLKSPDSDGGYPGEIHCQIAFFLSDKDELAMNYLVEAPARSFVNLTNHTYFNLNNSKASKIKNHILALYSDEITDIDTDLRPTGDFMKVNGTPLDFGRKRRSARILRPNSIF